jgi:pyruvate/2-oxoglutarate dehydrogenase complex dihydrolipoamide acyltransferase (E2) component
MPSTKELMPMSVTFDHRVIDGSGAAEFAQVLQDKINDPEHLWNAI